jgi:ATP-dependent 26S proteasome regulatory subunit
MQRLTDTGSSGPSDTEKLHLIARLRAETPEAGEHIDRLLIDQLRRMRRTCDEARRCQEELRALLEKLTAPPWFAATFLSVLTLDDEVKGMISTAQGVRVVGFDEDMCPDMLATGDQVLLNHEGNLIVRSLPDVAPPCGEMGTFQSYLDDGRLVIAANGEERVLRATRALEGVELSVGDQVRWDRVNWLACERIRRPQTSSFFLEETPDARPAQVGGQRANLQSLISALTTTLVDPDKARTYGLDCGRHTILMVGPPGCGKTLMARVAAGETTRMSGRKCRFGVVNAGAWEDPYVGVTQQNIRNTFAALRAAVSAGDLAVLFLDEVEAVGRLRGSALNQHGDKFLAALLCELDGFQDRHGVAIIAATNRADLLDPALRERLSEVEIHVARPDLEGARAIFEIHLSDSLPFSPNGSAAAGTRREIIELAVSRLYSPNAGNEVATLRFRDGRSRTITARELISGRVIEQICRAARQSAFLRDVQGGAAGVRAEDMEQSVAATIDKLTTTLTRMNVHAYLHDLPQDIDVVAVEPVVRRVRRPHAYTKASTTRSPNA